jgi:hypothetical protein
MSTRIFAVSSLNCAVSALNSWIVHPMTFHGRIQSSTLVDVVLDVLEVMSALQ